MLWEIIVRLADMTIVIGDSLNSLMIEQPSTMPLCEWESVQVPVP